MKKNIIVLIVFLLFFFGCQGSNDVDKDNQKNNDDYQIVSFVYPYYDYAMSSSNGSKMKFDLDGAFFDCSIEYGLFSYKEKIQNKTIVSGEYIIWSPKYISNSEPMEDMYENNINKAYMDVIVKMNDKIIGFIIIEMYKVTRTLYKDEVHTVCLFKDGDSYLEDVTLDYVTKQIEEAKEQKFDNTEKEMDELIYFPFGCSFNSFEDSYTGIIFIFNLDDAIFDCSVDYGSLVYTNNKNSTYSAKEGVLITWSPKFYITNDSNETIIYEEMYEENLKKAYIDIIIKIDEKIIGYAIIRIDSLGEHNYEAKVVSSYLSIKNGEYKELTLDYVNKELKKNKRREN